MLTIFSFAMDERETVGLRAALPPQCIHRWYHSAQRLPSTLSGTSCDPPDLVVVFATADNPTYGFEQISAWRSVDALWTSLVPIVVVVPAQSAPSAARYPDIGVGTVDGPVDSPRAVREILSYTVAQPPAVHENRGVFEAAASQPAHATAAATHRSPAMASVMQRIRVYQRYPVSVLLCGETGTGKEVVAREIHRGCRHTTGDFVAINCSAITETLFEAEMFGVERGAYTDARARAGCLERACAGSLFLDEIGDMPLSQQAKLLRAIENREAMRVGGTRSFTVKARFICATNQKPADLVRNGRFRSDLLYRIAGVVDLPPLRRRREDIPGLVAQFLQECSTELSCGQTCRLEPAGLRHLIGYHWPGNIRELRNTITRLVMETPTATIGEADVVAQIELSRAVWSHRDAADNP